jgi:16S rRNA (guanine527-N7)-methyltransferase
VTVSRETPGRWHFAASALQIYEARLATAGLERGLIGPREVDRLWERHILNSAVLERLIPQDVTVIDVGSGAGLPGIPLAIVRPDLNVVLLEPLLRRSVFLEETVDLLGLGDRVTVVRGRAEDRPVPPTEVVTARAVAALDQLITWCWPLVRKGGQLIALKGERAQQEVEEAGATLRKLRLTATIQAVENTAAVIVSAAE